MPNYVNYPGAEGKVKGDFSKDTSLNIFKYNSEVLVAFKRLCLMEGLVQYKDCSKAKGRKFNLFGRGEARYVKPGESQLEKVNRQYDRTQITIYPDYPLISDDLIDDFSALMNDFNERQLATEATAEALANKRDKSMLQQAILAAREPGKVEGMYGGSSLVYADCDSDVQQLRKALTAAAVAMDEKDVPDTDRNVILKPLQYRMLVDCDDVVEDSVGGDGSRSKGIVGRYQGLLLRKSNNLPTTDLTGTDDALMNNTYEGNFTGTVASVITSRVLGAVRLSGMKTEHQRHADRQSDYYITSLMVGSGILRPDCAVEIRNAALA